MYKENKRMTVFKCKYCKEEYTNIDKHTCQNFMNEEVLEEELAKLDEPKQDIINKPDHYHKGGFDVYEIMQMKMTHEEYKGFCKGNVLKYLFRTDLKGKPVEDLKKLRFNVDRAIEAYEGVEYIPAHKKTNNLDIAVKLLQEVKEINDEKEVYKIWELVDKALLLILDHKINIASKGE